MIEVENLSEKDIGRRVTWEVAPGVVNEGYLAAWDGGRLLIALRVTGKQFMRIVEDVDPAEVRWVHERWN
ncbi:MAG: hypothetical protein ACRD9R_08890 [Pyrinomonadaceae bacterium]